MDDQEFKKKKLSTRISGKNNSRCKENILLFKLIQEPFIF